MNRTLICSILALLSFNVLSQSQLDVEKLANRVAHKFMQNNNAPGVAIDIVVGGKLYYFTYGVANKKENTPIRKDTIFEIGSVTKVFTATMLAEAVKAKLVQLNSHVGSFLPEPLHGNKLPIDKVTFLQLATHTASLPRVPSNYHYRKPYKFKKFAEFLQSWSPAYPVGTKYSYSNVGFGVLGYALAGVYREKNFDFLMREKVLNPLSMEDTVYFVPKNAQERYAQGYFKNGLPAPRWKITAWKPAAGALRSTPVDMMKFLRANLGSGSSTQAIKEAMQFAHIGRFKVSPKMMQGLAWASHPLNGNLTFVMKNGETSGFSSIISMIPEKNIGLVVLTNVRHAKVNRVSYVLLKNLLRIQQRS